MDQAQPIHLLKNISDELYCEEKVLSMSNELQVTIRNRVLVFDLKGRESAKPSFRRDLIAV